MQLLHQNNISIWDVSSLQEMFLSRDFSMDVDFPFQFDGKISNNFGVLSMECVCPLTDL